MNAQACRFLLPLLLLSLSASMPAKTIKTAHGEWELVWKDDFRGHKLAWHWRRIPRYGTPPEWNKYMSADDRLYSVRGGKLTLYGRENNFLPTDTARFLTGGVFTQHRKLFYRGRLEIRLKMDNATGAWPAAWLLPEVGTWPDDGEIDIMERLNADTFAYQTLHSAFTERYKDVKLKPQNGFTGAIRQGRYNVYGVELYEDSLCFFINDRYIGTYRRETALGKAQYPYDRPMYLLLDMQLGGHWVGVVDPKELPYRYKIDYVKFYRKK